MLQEQSGKQKDALQGSLTQQLSDTQNNRQKQVDKSRAERQAQNDKAKREAEKKQEKRQKEQQQKVKERKKDGMLLLITHSEAHLQELTYRSSHTRRSEQVCLVNSDSLHMHSALAGTRFIYSYYLYRSAVRVL